MEYIKKYPTEFVNPLEISLKILCYCDINFFDGDISPQKKYVRCVVALLCLTFEYYSLSMSIIDAWHLKQMVDLVYTVPCHMIITQGCCYFCIYGAMVYFLRPLAEILVRKFVFNQECEMVLPFFYSYPFEPEQNWLVFAFVYMFQVFTHLWFTYALAGIGCLTVVLCSHLVTEFCLLHEDLLHMDPVSNGPSVKNIKNIVKKHQELLLLCHQLDEVFNKINFIKMLFATVVTCFYAFSAKMSDGSASVMMCNYIGVFGVLGPAYMICYYSQLLATESAGIADSAYNSLWYKGSVQHQKSIRLIIFRAQIPCCLTSLKYSPITLNTFSKVLSTTWSYFSLVSSLYTEDDV